MQKYYLKRFFVGILLLFFICLLLLIVLTNNHHLPANDFPRNVTIVVGREKIEFVHIPKGRFRMGKDYGVVDVALGNSESFSRPSFNVSISKGFYISKTNVDCDWYCRFMNSNIDLAHADEYVCLDADSNTRQFEICGDTYIIIGSNKNSIRTVSWYGAVEFCKWLSGETSISFRLPTEAEWELSIRGSGNLHDKTTWKSFERKRLSKKVLEKTTTPDGLCGFDVGNWTQDFFDYYSPTAKVDPKGPSSPNPYFMNKFGEAEHVLRWPDIGAIGRYSHTKSRKNEEVFGFRLCVDENCILDAIKNPQKLPNNISINAIVPVSL